MNAKTFKQTKNKARVCCLDQCRLGDILVEKL